jgi:putative DNA primase/helicase
MSNMQRANNRLQFMVRSDGLYVVGVGGARKLTAAPIRVWAIASHEGESTRYVIIKFKDMDGETRTLTLPRGELTSPVLIQRRLADAGFVLPHPRTDRNLLVEYLGTTIPESRIRLTRRVGWHDKTFVFPDANIGRANDLQFDPYDWQLVGNFDQSGTLESWKEQVARPCASSSRLTFAICVALAAPLLNFAGAGFESGGFHLYGRSSAGKSIFLIVAQAVSGSARRGTLRTWSATVPGLIDAAVGHCDSTLCLDELAVALNDPKIGIKGVSQAAFILASGRARTVSATSGHSRRAQLGTFRVMFFSTGEQSLYRLAASHGRQRLRGEEVRLMEIPAEPAGGRGFFSDLTEEHATDGVGVADAIETACESNYGMAFVTFLDHLIRRGDLSGTIARLIRDFYGQAAVPEADGWERRFGSRFALAYAAGMIGIEACVLPWHADIVRRSVTACYRDSRGAVPHTAEKVNRAIRCLKWHLAKNAINIDGKFTPQMQNVVRTAMAYKRHIGGEVCFIVPPTTLRKWSGPDMDPRLVVQQLVTRGLLLEDQERNLPTRQLRIPGLAERRRYFVIKGTFVEPTA